MITITSKDNPTYKSWIKLLKKKYRDQTNLFLVEEVNLVEEAILNKADIQAIIVRADMIDHLPSRISCKIDEKNIYTLPKELFCKINTTEATRGVMAVVRKKVSTLEDLSSSARPHNFIVVDRIQDPGNLGAIIRTADAAGMAGVVMLPNTTDPFSPKTLRSSTGSIFRIPIVNVDSFDKIREYCKSQDVSLVVTCLKDSEDLYSSNFNKPCAIVIGNEASGVSEEIIASADTKIRIPMYGSVESLNASVAGAIVMYEVVRQQHISAG